jgi:predicted nuclease with TOPRIM domain
MAKKKPRESVAELQKQREDIEALLASIEETYSEGSMPEDQYKEAKSQNEGKLEEINEKMDKAAAEGGGEPAPAAAAAAPVQMPAEEMPSMVENIPAPVEEPPPKKEREKAAPVKVEMPEELMEMIRGIKEGKIGTNADLIKRMEKVEVDVEKVKSFVDALGGERTSYDERFQRMSEELGELRSNSNNIDNRLGEVEIKSDESSTIVRNLKPQKLTQEIEARDNDIKMIRSRIEKIEDVISNTLKRVGEIHTLLRGLGSVDNLATMSKDIARKVIIIDDKAKKMDRMSDRIDTIFGELNKRLEEFMFYKAKQQSVDEMTQDLMRNIQEISTRLDTYAQKNDLDMIKDMMLQKIDSMSASGSFAAAAPMSGPGAEINNQIEEIRELDKMLDEQKKLGAMKDDEYKKTKEANRKKIDELQKKLASAAAPQVSGQPPPLPATAQIEFNPSKEMTKEETPFGEIYRMEERLPDIPIPVAEVPKQSVEQPAAQAAAPAETKEEEPEPEEPEVETRIKKGMTKHQRMLIELEDSFRSGLLSEKAYFRTKKVLESSYN